MKMAGSLSVCLGSNIPTLSLHCEAAIFFWPVPIFLDPPFPGLKFKAKMVDEI